VNAWRKEWHALHVKPRFERIVDQHLAREGYETCLPLQHLDSNGRHINVPLFPNYVFCKFPAAELTKILWIPGVNSISDGPATSVRLREHQVIGLQRIVASGLRYRTQPLKRGGPVVAVLRGPLRGLIGHLSQSGRVSQLIIPFQCVQRSVSVGVCADDVREIHPESFGSKAS
jgi:hypothetical protein